MDLYTSDITIKLKSYFYTRPINIFHNWYHKSPYNALPQHSFPEDGHNIAFYVEAKLGHLTPPGIKPNKLWAANWG